MKIKVHLRFCFLFWNTYSSCRWLFNWKYISWKGFIDRTYLRITLIFELCPYWSMNRYHKHAIITRGLFISFHTLEMSCFWWTGSSQLFFVIIPKEKSIIPTLSENLIKLSKHGLSYSQSLKSYFMPIGELALLIQRFENFSNKNCCLLFKSAIYWSEWGQLDGFAWQSFNFGKKMQFFEKNKALYQ